MTANAPMLKTNLDTDFLKLIAILSMVADHVGSAFFPQYPVFRWLGRLALFALISQPVYALNADPSAFWENLTNWNIFFTLVLSLLFMWGITHRKWYGIGTADFSPYPHRRQDQQMVLLHFLPRPSGAHCTCEVFGFDGIKGRE